MPEIHTSSRNPACSVMQSADVEPTCDDTNSCGLQLLLALPDDVLSIISASLLPRDLCNLGLCCGSLRSLAFSDQLWRIQCSLLLPHDFSKWRPLFSSYVALCRFLVGVHPLLGIWVHQNPELGNVVFVMLGFGSVVGCRIIPQEVGSAGISAGPLLWAPVFEIIAHSDGSAAFFLHGRDSDAHYLYPGSVKSIDPKCNILLLEVDSGLPTGLNFKEPVGATSQDATVPPAAQFSRLPFGDRRRLLELVANRVRIKAPNSLFANQMFPQLQDEELGGFDKLAERREFLLQLHKVGIGRTSWQEIPGLNLEKSQMESANSMKVLERPGSWNPSMSANWDEDRAAAVAAIAKRKTVGRYFRDGLKQILGRSNLMNGTSMFTKNGSSSSRSKSKHFQVQEFLSQSDMIGLSLHASNVKLTSYRAWPNMHENRFALYKLPLIPSTIGQEYAGLWGGCFGWPPGQASQEKPRKALFLILISYEELEGQQTLIGTKILEGSHYVLHPNGSAMFVVKVDEPSSDPFPWDTDGNSSPIEIKHAYSGVGITNGYGFRYPGSKPGSLFVMQNGLLAFVWKETRAVLTLQRLDLPELLKKGDRVPALPPIANFAYLTKSYSNVFAGFSIYLSSLPYPR